VPLNQALGIYVRLNKDSAKILAQMMLSKIAEGKPVSDAMNGWFSPAIVEIIRAGEEGGILVKTLRVGVSSLALRESAFTALFNIMVYPVVVICMALGVSIFINHSIFASFKEIIPIEKWPESAKTLSKIAEFVQHFWWLMVITIGAIIFLWMRFLSDYIGEARSYLDKLPIWALYRKMHSARFMETLGLLISNGLVLRKALIILQQKSVPYLASHLMMMQHRLGAGRDNIADVLDTGLISENDLTRLRLIAQTKGFEKALVRQGHRASDEASKSVVVTGKLCAGFLLALVALFAIFMITSIYTVGFSVVPT
jgi:type II secretory pathway component PulF